MKKLVVLISGRGRNLQAFIEASRRGELGGEIALVISNRADAAGLQLARDAGLPTRVIPHVDYATREAFDAALIAAIEPLQPDAIALAGFMRILTPAFIDRFQGRLLNIHPSLLPLYPGLHTHRRALEAGDREHGATVHFVTQELDGGPLVLQGRLAIEPGDDAESLATRVMEQVELRIYPQAVAWLLRGELSLQKQQVRFRQQALQGPLSSDAMDPAFF